MGCFVGLLLGGSTSLIIKGSNLSSKVFQKAELLSPNCVNDPELSISTIRGKYKSI